MQKSLSLLQSLNTQISITFDAPHLKLFES